MLLPTAAMVAAVPRPPAPPEHAASDFEQRAATDARVVPRYDVPVVGAATRQTSRAPRPPAAATRLSSPCRRHVQRACHRAVAGRAVARLGAVRHERLLSNPPEATAGSRSGWTFEV